MWGILSSTNSQGQMKHVFLVSEEQACGVGWGGEQRAGSWKEDCGWGRDTQTFHVLGNREERFSGGGSGPSVSRVAVAKGRAPDQGPGNIFLALP